MRLARSVLKQTTAWGALLVALVVAPRLAVEAFFWWDGRRVSRLPEWLSERVAWSLHDFYAPPDAMRWLRTPHPLLDHMAPADVLEAGGEERVLSLIEQLTTARMSELPLLRTTGYGAL